MAAVAKQQPSSKPSCARKKRMRRLMVFFQGGQHSFAARCCLAWLIARASGARNTAKGPSAVRLRRGNKSPAHCTSPPLPPPTTPVLPGQEGPFEHKRAALVTRRASQTEKGGSISSRGGGNANPPGRNAKVIDRWRQGPSAAKRTNGHQADYSRGTIELW